MTQARSWYPRDSTALPRRLSAACLLFLLLFAPALASATDRGLALENSTPQETDLPAVFRELFGKLAEAAPKASEKEFASLARDLALPDYKAWFVRKFGEQEGQKLSDQYQKLLPGLVQRLQRDLSFSTPGTTTEFRVDVWSKEKEDVAQGLDKVLLAALHEPFWYFKISIVWPGGGNRWPVAVFVYADGAFRYLPYDFFYALRGVPAQIRVGGSIQQTKLISQVPPVYPPLARQAGVSGTVRLRVIIAPDGSILQLEVVSGHPLLVQAALDAVRQWRYEPTLLNGQPVLVFTTVDVNFVPSGSPIKPRP